MILGLLCNLSHSLLQLVFICPTKRVHHRACLWIPNKCRDRGYIVIQYNFSHLFVVDVNLDKSHVLCILVGKLDTIGAMNLHRTHTAVNWTKRPFSSSLELFKVLCHCPSVCISVTVSVERVRWDSARSSEVAGTTCPTLLLFGTSTDT